MRAGFLLDRLVAHDRNHGLPENLKLPAGSVLSANAATKRFPELGGQPLAGAAVWYDYVTTESDRLTFSWALMAAARGATLANYVDATSLVLDGRRITGARAIDRLAERPLEIAARVVVNATGANLDALLAPAQAGAGTPMLRAMNLVTRLPGGSAGDRRTGRSRAAISSWCRGVVVPCSAHGSRRRPAHLRRSSLPSRRSTRSSRPSPLRFPRFASNETTFRWCIAGVVPAVADGRGGVRLEGHQLVRDHAAEASALEGLISVAGTKYTTARGVAEQITDRVVRKLGRPPIPCRTSTTPLFETVKTDSPAPGAAHSRRPLQLPADVQAHMAAAYGPAHANVLGLIEAQPGLADRIGDDMPVIGAELVWAVRHEMAMTLADAVVRRTPLGALGHPGEAAASRAAAILAGELRWDDERREAELNALTAIYRIR